MGISRRDLLKAGGVGALGIMGAGALVGCSANTGASSASDTLAAPLTDEQRMGAISDPIYMGAQVNASGQKLVMGTGKNGQIANQAMIDKHVEYEPKLHKLNDRVYCAAGNGMSNATMVLSNTGIIVIDTGSSNEEMQLNMDMFRTVTDKPVVAVLFTHDHFSNGTEAVVGKGNPNNLPLIANANFAEGSSPEYRMYGARSMRMFGMLLGMQGPDGSVGGGDGPYMVNPTLKSSTVGFIPPNTLIPSNDKTTTMVVDGLTIECWPMTADTSTSVNFYFPELKTAVTNSVWGVFFNLYTLRGAKYRDPQILIKNLDTILSWNAEYHAGTQGMPMTGKEEVAKNITLYRDCIQFVYDQTLRYMNMNYGPDEIVEKIKIPSFMIEGFSTKPIYGDVEHYYRSVYTGVVGWFGVDPLELHPVSKKFEYQRIIDLAGGPDAITVAAQKALNDKQYSWAATLANYVYTVDPENADAKKLKAEAMRQMAYVTYSTNTRHYLMTNVKELEGTLEVPALMPSSPTQAAAADRASYLNIMRVGLDPDKAIGVEKSMALTFTDENVTNTITVRNCVGAVSAGKPEKVDFELKMPFPVMVNIASLGTTMDKAIEEGKVEVVGSKDDLKAFFAIFDPANL
ncbi:MAG: alkyl sulfatase dimerization domain-containing protein [Eggerthellaceae bacterium]